MKGLQLSDLIGNWPFSNDMLALFIRGSQEMKLEACALAWPDADPGLCGKNTAASLPRTAKKVSAHPRTCSIGRPAGDTLCPQPNNLRDGVVGRTHEPAREITMGFQSVVSRLAQVPHH